MTLSINMNVKGSSNLETVVFICSRPCDEIIKVIKTERYFDGHGHVPDLIVVIAATLFSYRSRPISDVGQLYTDDCSLERGKPKVGGTI